MLAIVIFGNTAKPLSSFASAYDAGLVGAVQRLPGAVGEVGGGTNLAAGIRVANDLLAGAPRGLLRRAWVLSDGDDNVDRDRLWHEVDRARSLHVNLNTIGFGDPSDFDEGRLQEIARRTHNGRYVPVATAQALGRALNGGGRTVRRTAAHRGEATVFVIDTSGSMHGRMGGSKIEVVRDTLRQLLIYKQTMWS